jgi:hypothetical protein
LFLFPVITEGGAVDDDTPRSDIKRSGHAVTKVIWNCG